MDELSRFEDAVRTTVAELEDTLGNSLNANDQRLLIAVKEVMAAVHEAAARSAPEPPEPCRRLLRELTQTLPLLAELPRFGPRGQTTPLSEYWGQRWKHS